MTENEEVNNFEIFRDHLSASFIERLAPAAVKAPRRRTGKARRKEIKPVSIVVGEDEQLNDAAELSDFTEVCPCTFSYFERMLNRVVLGRRDISQPAEGLTNHLLRIRTR